MMDKKKCHDNRSNYRALGLLNHSYKIFACILLTRILPYIAPNISDMQAGFRKERGCQDNILILVSAINHLSQTEDDATSFGVVTYINFSAAFDYFFLFCFVAIYPNPTACAPSKM